MRISEFEHDERPLLELEPIEEGDIDVLLYTLIAVSRGILERNRERDQRDQGEREAA